MRYFKSDKTEWRCHESGHCEYREWNISHLNPEVLLGRLEAVETDAAGNPLGKYRYFRDTYFPELMWRWEAGGFKVAKCIGKWEPSVSIDPVKFLENSPTAYECDEWGSRLEAKGFDLPEGTKIIPCGSPEAVAATGTVGQERKGSGTRHFHRIGKTHSVIPDWRVVFNEDGSTSVYQWSHSAAKYLSDTWKLSALQADPTIIECDSQCNVVAEKIAAPVPMSEEERFRWQFAGQTNVIDVCALVGVSVADAAKFIGADVTAFAGNPAAHWPLVYAKAKVLCADALIVELKKPKATENGGGK